MKNLETKYPKFPVEGTSALQVHPGPAPARGARIIAFPERPSQDGGGVRCGIGIASLARAVRTGAAQGVPYGRVRRWQAVICGCVFAALALASLLMGL